MTSDAFKTEVAHHLLNLSEQQIGILKKNLPDIQTIFETITKMVENKPKEIVAPQPVPIPIRDPSLKPKPVSFMRWFIEHADKLDRNGRFIEPMEWWLSKQIPTISDINGKSFGRKIRTHQAMGVSTWIALYAIWLADNQNRMVVIWVSRPTKINEMYELLSWYGLRNAASNVIVTAGSKSPDGINDADITIFDGVPNSYKGFGTHCLIFDQSYIA